MSAMDLDFIDSEVGAQMDEEQMEEEEEVTIRGARWGGWQQWSYLSVGKDLIISIHPKTYLTLREDFNKKKKRFLSGIAWIT